MTGTLVLRVRFFYESDRVIVDAIRVAQDLGFRSRQEPTFAEKILSAMRKGFGGHIEPKAERP
jgi:6-phosphogluconate dehydrogenase